MNETSRGEKPYTRCLVEAAAWRAHLTELSLATAPEFEAWLAVDERHRAAWRQVAIPWDLLGGPMTPDLAKLRSDAREFLQKAARTRPRSLFRRFLLFDQRKTAVLSFAAAILIVVAGALFWALSLPTVYRTGPGERRIATLIDGSQVELDSSSEVLVRYSGRARELWLRAGQARFAVAHDTRRPFSVAAGGRKVIATGTAFDVDLLGPALYVTLLEGHVQVLDQNEVAQRTELRAGQQLVVSPREGARVIPANLERVLAWQRGQMVFDDEPLALAIERVNRYSSERLILADPQAAALRISGVFHTDNVRGFVDALTSYLPLRAERQRDTIFLRSQPGA